MKIFTSILITALLCASGETKSYKLRSPNKGARLVGGEEARSGQFPYSAAIDVQTSDSTFFCGGALINTEWILTAGHCVDGAILFTIRLGSNSLEGNDPNRVSVATSDYKLHPNYNPDTLANNVGLIRLRIPVEYTSYIQPIELTNRDTAFHAQLTAIGWGQISDSESELADNLQFVTLMTLTNTECMNSYGYQVSPDMVCAVGSYNEGTCIGDSGGPLIESIYVNNTVRHAAISTFISAHGCESTDPSGYTRTFLYLDWILSIIGISNK